MTSINNYGSSFGVSSLYSSLNPKQSKPAASTQAGGSDVISQFLAYQKMTPEQKLRDAVLKKLGMTEDGVKALPPQAQKEAEEKIQQEMKNMIQNKMAEKGILVDITV